MSQLNIIAMKKNSMRKNKKLVINIALKKETLASRLEADQQDLGSSREDEKKSLEPSEKRRDVLQRDCSKAEEIDGSIDEDEAIDDDHISSAGDGVMREVDVGTGLSGALNLLRDQGAFKEKKSKLVVVRDNHGDDRFRDAFKEIRIERMDECGRVLTMKEAFRSLSHGFHGKKPGNRKQEKRERKHEDKTKQMESSDRAVERIRQVHAALKSPYIVI
ncbi:unnamed protein product [Thlaspi arvense]|uniref:SART-1 family protein DOT2 n=1 Tax=Thlaspi arvense TaxID=13288 RepID=A0AAU9RYY2_THLAR|nr:unnamed protein product [Thlaspi arvense]